MHIEARRDKEQQTHKMFARKRGGNEANRLDQARVEHSHYNAKRNQKKTGDSKMHRADARQNRQDIVIGGTHCSADLCDKAGGWQKNTSDGIVRKRSR